MLDFVEEFEMPASMVHVVDPNGRLWSHLGVRFRGTWLMIDDDGQLSTRSVGHMGEQELAAALEKLISN